MKTIFFLFIMQLFIGCSEEEQSESAAILGIWNLTREISVINSQIEDSLRTEEVLYNKEKFIYDFKKDNQLLIKREGKPELLMRYSCYDDFGTQNENLKYGGQEYIDINETTFILSYSEGRLILDGSMEKGPILYFERE